MKLMTCEEARGLFSVVDGELISLVNRQGVKKGDVCGGMNSWGYIHFQYRGITYKAHRVVWLIVNGSWPAELDHINGLRHDNRIENLREVSRQENLRNQKLRTTNTSGVMGVTKEGSGWRARIRVDGKHIHLGYFEVIDQAVSARKKAEALYGFHPNHGRNT